MPELHELIRERSAFFANRVDTYAKAKGFSTSGVLAHLQDIAHRQGESSITGIIDAVVPPELHSSQMPPIIKQHYGCI